MRKIFKKKFFLCMKQAFLFNFLVFGSVPIISLFVCATSVLLLIPVVGKSLFKSIVGLISAVWLRMPMVKS